MSLSSERTVEININHGHLKELNRITAQVKPKQEQIFRLLDQAPPHPTSACVRSFLAVLVDTKHFV